MTARIRFLLCGPMTLKGLVGLYAHGWSPKMNLRLQNEAQVLRPRIFFINTTSKIELIRTARRLSPHTATVMPTVSCTVGLG